MGGFTLAGAILTPGNYMKYKRSEIADSFEGKKGYAPPQYSPADWRPPVEWYKKMNFPVPVFYLIKSNKGGRPAGSGERTARLEIRCMPELLLVLQTLQKESWSFKDMSTSDILHIMVASAAKTQLHINVTEEIEKAVEAISTVAYKNYNL